jgi:pimeloyl-ACP methyl ester carboxylesterase
MESRENRRSFLIGTAVLCGGFLLPVARASATTFTPTRFSVEVVGSGPDVILIPGLASSRQVWRPTVAALPGYRYHLVQVGGFAGEPVRDNMAGPVVAGVAEQLALYISAHDLHRPAVIGHSMGATIGLELALRHPDTVGKIMVVDMLPQPSAMMGSTPEEVRPLADNLLAIAEAPQGRALVGALAGLFGPPADAALHSDPDVVARSLHELATTDLRPELSDLKVPMTVVYACASAKIGAEVNRVFTAAYRGARHVTLVRIDDSSHFIMADQPEEFQRAMRSFLIDRAR